MATEKPRSYMEYSCHVSGEGSKKQVTETQINKEGEKNYVYQFSSWLHWKKSESFAGENSMFILVTLLCTADIH